MTSRNYHPQALLHITWVDPDSDWNRFSVLWSDHRHLLLRGREQRHHGKVCQHDGIPFVVEWDQIKSIKVIKMLMPEIVKTEETVINGHPATITTIKHYT